MRSRSRWEGLALLKRLWLDGRSRKQQPTVMHCCQTPVTPPPCFRAEVPCPHCSFATFAPVDSFSGLVAKVSIGEGTPCQCSGDLAHSSGHVPVSDCCLPRAGIEPGSPASWVVDSTVAAHSKQPVRCLKGESDPPGFFHLSICALFDNKLRFKTTVTRFKPSKSIILKKWL